MWSHDGCLNIANNFSPNHFVPLMTYSNKVPEKKRRKTSSKIVNPIVIDDNSTDEDSLDAYSSIIIHIGFEVMFSALPCISIYLVDTKTTCQVYLWEEPGESYYVLPSFF